MATILLCLNVFRKDPYDADNKYIKLKFYDKSWKRLKQKKKLKMKTK